MRTPTVRRASLAALLALAAGLLGPRAALAQRRAATIQFAAEQPPFMPTAGAVQRWLAAHHTDAFAENTARHAWVLYVAVLFPRAAGTGPFTLTWSAVEPDGSRRAVAAETFPYDQPTSHVLVREVPLPATPGQIEADHAYEAVLTAGGREIARGTVRLTPAGQVTPAGH